VASAANRRRVLVLADQGISTLSNVVVAVIVARSLPSDGFGAFGVATVAYLLVAGAGRALLGEPLLSRYSHRDRATRDAAIPDLQVARTRARPAPRCWGSRRCCR
jgi:hypothetical protein